MNEISKPSAFIAETAREAAIQRRYREPLDVAETPWHKTIASQLNHRSVRAYLPDALPPGTLEILVAADIVRTIALDSSFQSVLSLGLLVVIRTFLSWSLILEVEGRWPWQREASEKRVDEMVDQG